MSFVAFPCQHNGLQALSIQRVKSEFPSFQEVLFAPDVRSVGASEYGLDTAQTQETVRLWSNK